MLYLMHAARAAADTCVTIEIENFLISALQQSVKRPTHVVWMRHNQCDQIGRFLKVRGNKYCLQNIGDF